ncbi:MAG: hypothetical protein Q4G00_01355 [Clostridia bacterium]|nr:hypothetical protein [Clostridia bacterium]
MAYIRSPREELTGYQERAPFRPSIDLRCDFVMVYGTDPTMPQRIREYRSQGYTVHLMTGISWGEYQDYLDGKWDGTKHWDEGQRDRNDQQVSHGPTVPYMCPTLSFADYLAEKLKTAVDCGAEAIHMEEPEYWDHSGYSPAFQREYENYYHEPWRPQHESPDAAYRSARLKVFLYCRAIGRISEKIKAYAKEKYGKDIRFYVPTHSLINYTTWKILSPEAELLSIPSVDGYIAQVWTGTSREGSVYEGAYRERTFETAFLEYGVMQELVRGTSRRMWFLNDPIEDRPMYTWENYELNYKKTLTASLLQPRVWHYEICPWPHRVFDGNYPRIPENAAAIPADTAAGQAMRALNGNMTPKPIPEAYASLLSAVFQLMGDMDQQDWEFENQPDSVGIFLSDSALYQRTFPDGIVQKGGLQRRMNKVLCKNTDPASFNREASQALMREVAEDPDLALDFIQSMAFPQFYGLALPLLKYGLAVRPVQLDNLKRFSGYLNGMRVLILSYEFLKPASIDIHTELAAWIRDGGKLIYVGDGSDPFHQVRSWWREAGYADPSAHLFQLCGLPKDANVGRYPVGKGAVTIVPYAPYTFCLSKAAADAWRQAVHQVLAEAGLPWQDRSDLTLRRGPYLISAVMDESVNNAPKVLQGLFADMLENNFAILRQKTIQPDSSAILFDFSKIEKETFRVIGSSARIEEASVTENAFTLRLRAADRIRVHTRLRLPGKVTELRGTDDSGNAVSLHDAWDDETRTLLLGYSSRGKAITVTGSMQSAAGIPLPENQ